MNASEKVVCVTGASGYVASWLVKFLLNLGYTVRATVRDPNDPKKIEHLVSLDGAKERLHLFKADLLEEGCFDSIVDGCQGVFHTASPVIFSSTDPQAELIDPAIKGTLDVLKSCAKIPTIRRVVLTASIVSVLYNENPLTPDVVVDETWFSDSSFCVKNKHWYMASKTLAEEAAWKFAKENGIDLVVLNPGFMFGPHFRGENTFPSSTYWLVDVRDVAYAHIQAFEIPSASGRYCLVEKVVQFPEILKTLNQLYPTLGLQAKSEDEDKPLEPVFKVSQEKARSLGVGFIPWDVGLREIIESLKDKGFLSI
ncbi:hypothetical protein V6N11_078059 [Hibiscus sabdariffa]|uniref:NAD-dependent epimerase/dehydratase domain-containing protein n=1 Tax=Hibiscus sabdariffa TaxID=183260 RepID=A0ABR2TFU8_9ROSI